jgi:hypothetical protein
MSSRVYMISTETNIVSVIRMWNMFDTLNALMEHSQVGAGCYQFRMWTINGVRRVRE